MNTYINYDCKTGDTINISGAVCTVAHTFPNGVELTDGKQYLYSELRKLGATYAQ